VFLYLTICEKKQNKISFTYDQNQSVNIIRSPIETELQQPEARNRIMENLAENAVDYENTVKPYTIVFIANPVLRDSRSPRNFRRDPIIDDPTLFYRSVDNALKSFESDEILGNKAILKRIRVMTVFNDTLENKEEFNLADRFPNTLTIDDLTVSDVLSPQPKMIGNTREIIHNSLTDTNRSTIEAILGSPEVSSDTVNSQIDLIFALSASADYTRSSALFTDFNDDMVGACENIPPEKAYTVEVNPDDPEILSTAYRTAIEEFLNTARATSTENSAEESNYTKCPGRVAINVLECRQKTYIHEFAHAMSSYVNGAITDEYTDNIMISAPPGTTLPTEDIFYINKLGKADPPPAKFRNFVPTPVRFMKFNSNQYYSDLSHPSATETWTGYFPERIEPADPCTMDRSASRYRFDKLISAFIYNKLTARFNRR